MNSVKLLKDVPIGNRVQPFFWKLFTVKTKIRKMKQEEVEL